MAVSGITGAGGFASSTRALRAVSDNSAAVLQKNRQQIQESIGRSREQTPVAELTRPTEERLRRNADAIEATISRSRAAPDQKDQAQALTERITQNRARNAAVRGGAVDLYA